MALAQFLKMRQVGNDKFKRMQSELESAREKLTMSDPFASPNLQAIQRMSTELADVLNAEGLPADRKMAMVSEIRGRLDQLLGRERDKMPPSTTVVSDEDNKLDIAPLEKEPPPSSSGGEPLTAPLGVVVKTESKQPATPAPASPPPPPHSTATPVLPKREADHSSPSPALGPVKNLNESFDGLADEVGDELDQPGRRKVMSLKNQIKGNQSKLSMSRHRELKINGNVIPGSDFPSLFRFLFSGDKPTKAIGMPEFFKALARMGITSGHISNRAAAVELERATLGVSPASSHTRAHSSKQTGKGKDFGDDSDDDNARHAPLKRPAPLAPPPMIGKRPRVLELY